MLARKGLKAKGGLKATKSLARSGPIKPKTKKAKALKPSKLPVAPKRSRRGPERDPAFLSFVRTQRCDVEGCLRLSEAHHFGKRGKGQKSSDHEVIGLCHEHHMQWHSDPKGLPGRTREEWKERWAEKAAALLQRFEGQKP